MNFALSQESDVLLTCECNGGHDSSHTEVKIFYRPLETCSVCF